MIQNFIEEIEKFSPKKIFSGKKRFYPGLRFGFVEEKGVIDNRQEAEHLDDSMFKKNIVFAYVFVLATFLVLVARAMTIQIIGREKYLSLAKDNRIREIMIQPERGVVFDRNGEIIARNRPAFFIQLNTQICSLDLTDTSKCMEFVRKASEISGLKFDEDRILKELNERRPVILVETGLEKSEILSLEANIRDMPGLIVAVQPVRDYVYPFETAHVLGYTGLDETDKRPMFVGKTGIEKVYNQSLAGIPGTQIVQIDSTGTNYEIKAQQDPLPGKNLQLYLDSALQKKSYEVLKNKIETSKPDPLTGFKAEAGVIVAQDPITGGILALVSYPSFDSNEISSGLSGEEYQKLITDTNFPFYNRAVAAAYPPGSTFKMVPASAALMEGVVTKDTIIFDPGYIRIGSFIFRNWKLDGHGEVNMLRALQVSNDTYFYTIGGGYGNVGGLGITKLSNWAKKFGFGSLTEIDLDGEVAGFFPDGTEREWYLGDSYITTIGQGDVLATPLQVNNMVAYFANGGYLMVPKVVKSVDGVNETEVRVINQNIVTKEHYELIRKGMHLAVISGGTGYPVFDFPIKHPGIELAGKTGTSEYIDKNGNNRTHAWFSVFGPYTENYLGSEIVVTVFLEGGGGGSDEAAPLAREVLETWFEGR